MAILFKEAGMALYRQVADHLRDEIETQLQPGEMLPPEPVLSQKFSVNRHTIRSAVDVLIAEGMVERMQGVGTRVVDRSMVYSIGAFTRFTAVFDELGIETKSKVIGKKFVNAPDDISSALGLKRRTKILCLDTLRFVEEQPFSLVRHYLVEPYSKIVNSDYIEGSLHYFLNEKFGLMPTRRQSFISVRVPSPKIAGLLKISPSLPVMRVKNINVNPGTDQPVEFGITTFRGDRVELSVNFMQNQNVEGAGKRS